MTLMEFFYGVVKPQIIQQAIDGTLPYDLNDLEIDFPETEIKYKVVHESDYMGDVILDKDLSLEEAEYQKSHFDERFCIDCSIIKQ